MKTVAAKKRDIEWELDGERGETSSGSWTGKGARHRVGAGRGKGRDIEWELDGEKGREMSRIVCDKEMHAILKVAVYYSTSTHLL